MSTTLSGYASLKRLLTRGITVGDVAEALASLDATASAAEFARLAGERDFDVIGARAAGVVMGYVVCEGVAGSGGSAEVEFIDPDQLLAQDAPLHEAIGVLDRHPRAFVTALGDVAGIVTRSDLEKAPARMWVFGTVTLVETALRAVIRRRHPDDGWTEVLSAKRVERTRALQDERARRGEVVELLDCLQFDDLADLVSRHEDVRGLFDFKSRRAAQTRLKEWAKLRNHIAHSQGYVHANWSLIVRIAGGIDRLGRILDLI